MKVIILAAGQGTRLKKYTENLPKGMLNYAGKTILQHQIELYRKCGIEKIVIVRGYAADKIDYPNIIYYTNENFAETNMVESLLTAEQEFDDDVIVSYADILFEEDMLRRMMAEKSDFAVAVDDDWKSYWLRRYGRIDFDTESLLIDDEGKIRELGLPDSPIEQISARYIGLLKFSRAGLVKIKETMRKAALEFGDKPWQQSGKPVCKAYMTDLLNELIESGQDVKAVRFHNGWIEFDTNEDYEQAIQWIETEEIKRIIG